MTFDIAPDWLDLAIGGYFSSVPQSQKDAVRSAPVPTCPDRATLAALVRELCAEGTLSPDQMNMMFDSAELADVVGVDGGQDAAALA